MQMQEPEQRQQYEQEWQTDQEYGGYRAEYSGMSEQEQGQKVYPEKERRQVGKVIGIIAIVLSSVGFFLSLAGIIISSLVLHYANGREVWLTGGVVGLVASILIMVACTVCFVFAVVALAIRSRRIRRRQFSI
jgi:ABC-type Fe3+ transport system permease subunit